MTAPRADGFQPFAVHSRHGAHVTPQAGLLMLDRYWTTTSRDSLKRRAVHRHGTAGAAIAGDGRVTLVAGRTTVLDPTSPAVPWRDPLALAASGVALGRLGLDHLRQLVGYVEAGTQVPRAWSPLGRVVLVIRPEHSLTYGPDGIESAAGRWERDRATPNRIGREAPGPSTWHRSDDAPAGPGALLAAGADAGAPAGPSCAVGALTAAGPVAVPAAWDPERRQALLPHAVVVRLGLGAGAGMCISLDCSDDRRPDQKYGIMLRGTGRIGRVDETTAAVALDAHRVTWWDGFRSGTCATPASGAVA